MTDHKTEPVRKGRFVVCRACGYGIVRYRATRLIRKAHWRHLTFAQSYIGERSAAKARAGL